MSIRIATRSGAASSYAALLAAFLLPVIAVDAADMLYDVPDYTQTDVRGAGSGNGQQYCAPVAVSSRSLSKFQYETSPLRSESPWACTEVAIKRTPDNARARMRNDGMEYISHQ